MGRFLVVVASACIVVGILVGVGIAIGVVGMGSVGQINNGTLQVGQAASVYVFGYHFRVEPYRQWDHAWVQALQSNGLVVNRGDDAWIYGFKQSPMLRDGGFYGLSQSCRDFSYTWDQRAELFQAGVQMRLDKALATGQGFRFLKLLSYFIRSEKNGTLDEFDSWLEEDGVNL